MSMPPPPPPGSAYGAPYGSAPQAHPRGVIILVLGILSLFFCGIVLGPIAWIMGNNALAEIDRNPAAYTNRGLVQAGRVIGIIGTVLGALGILLLIGFG
jgi:hypothetical protein